MGCTVTKMKMLLTTTNLKISQTNLFQKLRVELIESVTALTIITIILAIT